MKKVFSLFLCFAILFSTLSIVASATEITAQNEEIFTTACEVFPEYADKIRLTSATTSTNRKSSEPVELLFTETRAVSEDRTIMYSEFSNGAVLLTSSVFSKDETTNSSSELGGVVTTTCTITVVCNYFSNVRFTLSRIIYKMLANDYDYIVSAGTPSTNNSSRCIYNDPNTTNDDPYIKMKENASGDAEISYYLRFYDTNWDCYDGDLIIKVGDNSYSCDFESKVG